MLPSVELNCVLPGERDGHVLALGIDDALEELASRRPPTSPRTGDWIAAHGGVAYLAHPYWTGVTPGTLELPETVSGIEVFNAGCELEIGRGLSTVHWDELLRCRPTLCFALATDDSHHPGLRLRPRVDVGPRRARPPEAVLEALRTGCFYGSTGPRIAAVAADGRRDRGEVRSLPPSSGVRRLERSGRPRRSSRATATAARSSTPRPTG